ncbi:MAG: IS982 family transposase, partial [Niabella sp.]
MKKQAWVLKLGNQPTHAMLLNELKIIEIFCQLDDFVKGCEKIVDGKLIGSSSAQSVHKPGISDSEMACIELLYHLSGYKCFQYYYQQAVERGPLKALFPLAPSYNRFVQLKPRILPLTILYLNLCRIGWLCGLYYADATALRVCHNLRISSNKVFAGKARRGKTSTGWFYGFKLFLVVNAFGEIIKVMFTTGNIADNNTEHMLKLFGNLKGQLFADKGFINQKAFEQLLSKGLKVVTGIKSNMKNKLMDYNQKLLLKKRGMIESVNDILKTVCDIEHTRHRSPINALLNVLPGFALILSWNDSLISLGRKTQNSR